MLHYVTATAGQHNLLSSDYAIIVYLKLKEKNMLIERRITLFLLALLSIIVLTIGIKLITVANQDQEVAETAAQVKAVNLKHLQCLATGIYREAGSEPFLGQIAVARVIVNRVTHGFGSDPCKVVYSAIERDSVKLCQFSWVCDNLPAPIESSASYQQALQIAKQVLSEDKWNDLIPNNVLFFHNLTVQPRWVYKKVMTIGNHVFYSRGKEKIVAATN
jgi:spore germination cell wall hydrolase CwlJ-like protein